MSDTERRIVGERGQVTLPKELRERLDIQGGDSVVVHEDDGSIVIKKPVTRDELAEGYRRRASEFADITAEMDGVSSEADDQLGDVPDWD